MFMSRLPYSFQKHCRTIWRRDYKEDTWRPQQSTLPKKFSFAVQMKEFRLDYNLISQSFLHRFQNLTLFLKFS
ncbi:hypothetical protein CsatA_026481 [Cannabis sativa]